MPVDDLSGTLQSLGFSQEAAKKTESMLLSLPNWSDQFQTGKTDSKLKKENKTTRAQGLTELDIDNRPGRQPGDEGKQKNQSSQAIFPTTIPKGNPQQGPRSRSDLTGLSMFDENPAPQGECRPKPQPRSPEQRQSTQQAQQAAQQQGQTFDSMPQQQVQDMGRQGGQAERKKSLPICPS